MVSKVTRWQLRYFRFPEYWNEQVEEISLPGEVLSRLDALYLELGTDDDANPTVYVKDHQGDMLHVCMASKAWILILHASGGNCWVSVADNPRSGNCAFLFPEWTELPKRHLIHRDVARAALLYWLTNGTRSPLVTWE
jgi:hypothetical protein